MEYLNEWIAVYSITLFAAMSPGPDFFVAVRSALVHNFKTACMTSLGLAMGVGTHCLYCILGVGLLISQSILLFNIIKWVGAAYLIYIGIQSVRSKGAEISRKSIDAQIGNQKTSYFKALKTGFVTNVMNPQATLFFLSLFTQIISPETPFSVQAGYIVTSMVVVFSWFAFLSVIITRRLVRRLYERASKWIDRLMGVILIGLGIRIALGK